MWLPILFYVSAAVWLQLTLSALFHMRWARRLPAPPANGGSGAIRCSVVVPARNEAARIEETVRRLLAQCGVEIEVIVVDDRSTDATGEIARRIADERVRVLRIEELPEGWLGKCHACHVGANAATGEWLLFTDADCWLRPDVLARALSVAKCEAADHIVLTPGIVGATIAAQAWHLAFVMSLANWFSGVNRDRPKAYLGMGAFNFMRTTAYRACGGYEALRLTVIDDLRLGLLLKRAGKRTRGFIGGDDAQCHWGTTLPAMIKIMEKNFFAAMDFRSVGALVAGTAGLVLWAAAVLGPFTGTLAGTIAGIALFSSIIPGCVFTRRLGWTIASALALPFVYSMYFFAMLNSAVVTIRQRGIRWRDTFYPLETLRRSQVR